VLVKITTTNICGSDLHMYEGRTIESCVKNAMVSAKRGAGPIV
jgi:threonine dehydrogenase-like Zn-dependent dehydrogenase